MRKFVIILFSTLVVGCASKGFNRGALRDQLGVKKPVVTDVEIAKALKLKANLPKPFKLGVYLKPGENNYHSHNWRWNDADKEMFLNIAKDGTSSKMISEVFQILPSTVSGKDIKAIRLAAARHGADAVLVVSGVGDVDKYTNNLGWTYIFLATALFVPGSEADALFMASASLWDVRNEYLYLTAEAESKINETYIPAFGRTNRELLISSKVEALKKLKAELLKMVNGIKKNR